MEQLTFQDSTGDQQQHRQRRRRRRRHNSLPRLPINERLGEETHTGSTLRQQIGESISRRQQSDFHRHQHQIDVQLSTVAAFQQLVQRQATLPTRDLKTDLATVAAFQHSLQQQTTPTGDQVAPWPEEITTAFSGYAEQVERSGAEERALERRRFTRELRRRYRQDRVNHFDISPIEHLNIWPQPEEEVWLSGEEEEEEGGPFIARMAPGPASTATTVISTTTTTESAPIDTRVVITSSSSRRPPFLRSGPAVSPRHCNCGYDVDEGTCRCVPADLRHIFLGRQVPDHAWFNANWVHFFRHDFDFNPEYPEFVYQRFPEFTPSKFRREVRSAQVNSEWGVLRNRIDSLFSTPSIAFNNSVWHQATRGPEVTSAESGRLNRHFNVVTSAPTGAAITNTVASGTTPTIKVQATTWGTEELSNGNQINSLHPLHSLTLFIIHSKTIPLLTFPSI